MVSRAVALFRLASSTHPDCVRFLDQGVIRVTVESGASAGSVQGEFSSALATAMGFKEITKGAQLLNTQIMNPFCELACLSGDWSSVREAFKQGAMSFVAKHKRLPALVIDGAEFLMNDVHFVDELVDLAKVLWVSPNLPSTYLLPSLICVLIVLLIADMG